MDYKVADIMTKNPLCYTVPSSISEIIKLLIKNNITGVPIKDNQNKYQGIITRRDIFYNPDETQTALVMRKAPTVNESDSINVAAKQLYAQKKRHIAVVNDNNEITGILTPQNFLNVIKEKYGRVKVKNVMEYSSVPCWEETPLSVVLLMMKLSQIYSFPVINKAGKFTGLVTDRDIFDKVRMYQTIESTQSGIADDEDPWSWDGIKNVFTYFIEKSNIKVPDISVKKLEVGHPQVIYLESDLEDAVNFMAEKNYNQLPVLTGHGDIYGMLYDIEIMKIFND
ncbi:CBS domain-containing protein [Ferroplasma sp.]|uniref:CBS domain-containing protein n=1 Tax=Ferroplasma sp. TaxID=2591003 RepID=UPI00307DD26B